MILIGVTFALIEGNSYATLLNLVPNPDVYGTACGLLGVFLNFALLLMPPLVSWSYDNFGSYAEQNVLFAIVVGVGTVISFQLLLGGSADKPLYNEGGNVYPDDYKPASTAFVVSASAMFGLMGACAYVTGHGGVGAVSIDSLSRRESLSRASPRRVSSD